MSKNEKKLSKRILFRFLRDSINQTRSTEKCTRETSSIIQKCVEYVLGISYEEYHQLKLSFLGGTGEENSQLQRKKIKSIRIRLQMAKEAIQLVQKNFRLLQQTQKQRENQMKQQQEGMVVTHVNRRKNGMDLKDDLDVFEIAILKEDLERHRIFVQRSKSEIDKLQNLLVKYEEPGKHTKSSVVPSYASDGSMDGFDFSSMSEECQNKFIHDLNELLSYQNRFIRQQFKRNSGPYKFTGIFSDVEFWKEWYRKRQVHQYALMLDYHFQCKILKPRTILDDQRMAHVFAPSKTYFYHPISESQGFMPSPFRLEKWQRRQEFHQDFFLGREDFPLHNEWSFDDDETSWKDSFYNYFYHNESKDKINLERPTISEEHIWKEADQIEKALNSKYSVNLVRRFLFCLCRLTSNQDRGMYILSYLVDAKGDLIQSNQDYEISVSDSQSVMDEKSVTNDQKNVKRDRKDENGFHRSFIKPSHTFKDIAFQFSIFIGKRIRKTLLRYVKMSPIFLIKKLKSQTPMRRSLLSFVNRLSQIVLSQSDKKRNIELVILFLIQRLLLEDEKFWRVACTDILYSTERKSYFDVKLQGGKKKKTPTDYKTKLYLIVKDVLDNYQMRNDASMKTIDWKREIQSLKQRSKLLKGTIHLQSSTPVPQVSSILLNQSTSDLSERIKTYFNTEHGIQLTHLEKHHVQQFATAEVDYLMKTKHQHLLSELPLSFHAERKHMATGGN